MPPSLMIFTTVIAYMTYRYYSLWDHGKKAMIILTICTYIPVAVMGFIVMVYDFRKHNSRPMADKWTLNILPRRKYI